MQPFPVYEDCSELVAGKSIYVRIHETSTPVMWNFHIHSHYEITFILEGNVSVLLPEQIHTGTEMRVVMLRPYTQHYMIPDENQLYRRANISFTEEYVSHMPVEWNALRSVFPENGAILLPDMEEAVRLEQILTVLEKEGESYGGRFLLMYCLSLLKEFHIAKESETVKTPAYILEALRYYDEHFAEKITAQELAERIGVSRTTLMTGFRRYIGIPMHQYQQKLRMKQAEDLRKQGLSVVQAAEASGFSDVGGYIRAHRQLYGVTPTGRK